MTRHWADPRHQGQGIWAPTPRPLPGLVSSLAAFIACLLLVVLFLGTVTVGRHLMCATHDNALRYCPGYAAVTR